MSHPKERLTVTVDRELIEAGHHSVASGRADSLSGWVNLALVEQIARERKLEAIREAVAAYEAEFGTISEAEVAAQGRADRRAALVIRGGRARGGHRKRRPVR